MILHELLNNMVDEFLIESKNFYERFEISFVFLLDLFADSVLAWLSGLQALKTRLNTER